MMADESSSSKAAREVQAVYNQCTIINAAVNNNQCPGQTTRVADSHMTIGGSHVTEHRDSKIALAPKEIKQKKTSSPELQTPLKMTLEQASSQRERLEDVFQDEIIKAFADITLFKKFARSKNGLCLDQSDIKTIVDESSVEEQMLKILFKWREIKGEKATVPKIRHFLRKYFREDNPTDYIILENGIFGIYKTRFLCKKSKVYLGEQISDVSGTQTRAIKLVPEYEGNLREAKILMKLGNHVNVVSIIHAGIYHAEPYNYIYIVMEHSWTQTVRNMIEECINLPKPFNEFIAWCLVEQLMRAVEFLHSHNIIHRDVKPDNILASDDWRNFKLTDFELSKEVKDGSATIQTDANTGTEGYRSRETYNLEVKITVKTDIFSAGATIGEIMANGIHPFGDDSDLWKYNIKKNKINLSHLCVINKDQVISLIKPMLEMDPEKRPTANKVLNDVSRHFQTFQLNNQQTTTDESLGKMATAPKIRHFLQKFFRRDNPSVLTGTTADESAATTSKAITEPSITEREQVKATQETLKVAKKAEVTPELAAVEKPTAKKEQVDKPVKDEPKEQKEKRKGILKRPTKQFLKTPAKAKEEVNAIIVFNKLDKHMYSYNLSTKKWSRMQVFPVSKRISCFTTVVSGKHIYFIQDQKVHQLEYSDSAAKWKEMSSIKEDHGKSPPAVMLNGLFYVCGGGLNAGRKPSRAVERYDTALDRWDRMRNMNIARFLPCVVATEDHIYCIGGHDEQYDQLQSVERFDERLSKWEFVESAPRPLVNETAAVVKNRIYVTNPKYKGVLCYDIQNNSWSEIDVTIQWPFVKYYDVVKILAVDDELYFIGNIRDSKGNFKKAMYLLEPETKQMTLIEEFEDKNINSRACLAVKL